MAARKRSATSAKESSALIKSTRRGPPNTWAPSSGRFDAQAKANIMRNDDFPRPPGATSRETAPRVTSQPCKCFLLGGTLGSCEIDSARPVCCTAGTTGVIPKFAALSRARAASRQGDTSRPASRLIASSEPTVTPPGLGLQEAHAVSKSASLDQRAPRFDHSSASWRASGHPSRSASRAANTAGSQRSRGSLLRLSSASKQALIRALFSSAFNSENQFGGSRPALRSLHGEFGTGGAKTEPRSLPLR